jgi:uncharacterized protein with ParB-like and HNH nuclease domain
MQKQGMSATNFKTENNTYRKLIGNGLTYRVPRFQRDYSWTDEEWEDLWSDMIDGQQRLSTLSLIVLAALKNLKRLVEEGLTLTRCLKL